MNRSCLAVAVLIACAATSCSSACPAGTVMQEDRCERVTQSSAANEQNPDARDGATTAKLGNPLRDAAQPEAAGTPARELSKEMQTPKQPAASMDAGAPKVSTDAGNMETDAGQDHMVCDPGTLRCEGAQLEVCNDAGQYEMQELCAPAEDDNGCHTAACENNACVSGLKPAGSSCSRGKCNASGACVECLSASDCPSAGPCDELMCTRGSCGSKPKPDGSACDGSNVCMAGECAPPPKTLALRSYWHVDRMDNFTTATAEGVSDAEAVGYSYNRIEGYVFETQQPGTVALRQYWNSMRNDNFATATAAGVADAEAAGYEFVRVEGYVYESQRGGTVPLMQYYSSERNDNFATGTADGENDARAVNYVFLRNEGFVLTSP